MDVTEKGNSRQSTIDMQEMQLFFNERSFWRNVLERLIDIVTFLSKRNLAFKGSNEISRSTQNGNFLRLFELLAKRDSILSELKKQSNQAVTASFEPGLISFQLISHLCYYKLDLPFLLRLTYFLFLINLSLIIEKEIADKRTEKEGLQLLIGRVELLTLLKLCYLEHIDYCFERR